MFLSAVECGVVIKTLQGGEESADLSGEGGGGRGSALLTPTEEITANC